MQRRVIKWNKASSSIDDLTLLAKCQLIAQPKNLAPRDPPIRVRKNISDSWIEFTLKHLVKINRLNKQQLFAEATQDLVSMVVAETAKLAENEVALTNKPDDQQGLSLDKEGNITRPDGFTQAHQAFSETGWGSLQFDPSFTAQDLSFSLSNAISKMVHNPLI